MFFVQTQIFVRKKATTVLLKIEIEDLPFQYRPGGGDGGGGGDGLGAPAGGGGLGAPDGGGGLGAPCAGARRSGKRAGLDIGFDSTSSGPSESHRMAVIAELNNIDKAIISH